MYAVGNNLEVVSAPENDQQEWQKGAELAYKVLSGQVFKAHLILCTLGALLYTLLAWGKRIDDLRAVDNPAVL